MPGDPQTLTYPVYYAGSYKTLYKTFMRAMMNRYAANSNVGYIRFGLARGVPPADDGVLGSDGDRGLQHGVGELHHGDDLDAEGPAAGDCERVRGVQLMAGINQYGSPIQLAAIAFEAQNAMSLGFGFGSQGLQGAT